MEHELPIACTLTPGEIEARGDELLPGLLRWAIERQPIAAGYAFSFPAKSVVLEKITQVIDAERQCCAFLRFQLTVEPGGGPISLALTGPAGTREFLEGLVAERG